MPSKYADRLLVPMGAAIGGAGIHYMQTLLIRSKENHE